MIEKKRPFRAMLFRDIRLCKHGVIPMFALICALVLLCSAAAVSMKSGAESSYNKAKIAVVDDDASFVSSFAISLISGHEFATPIEIEKTDMEDAEAGLENGVYSAAVLLPENYTRLIMRGEPLEIKVILNEGAQLHSSILRSVAGFGSKLIRVGQFGVFSGEKIAYEKYPDEAEIYLDRINPVLLGAALEASESIFTEEELPYENTGMSASGYYLLLYITLFFMLSVIAFVPMLSDVNSGVYRRLKSSGLNNFAFVLWKIVIPFAVFMLIFAGTSVILNRTTDYVFSPTSVILSAVAIGFSVYFGISLCIAVSKRTVSVLLICILSLFGLFCLGGIIPRHALAAEILIFGEYTPFGIVFRLLSSGFGVMPDIGTFLFLSVYILLCVFSMRIGLKKLTAGEGDEQ